MFITEIFPKKVKPFQKMEKPGREDKKPPYFKIYRIYSVFILTI